MNFAVRCWVSADLQRVALSSSKTQVFVHFKWVWTTAFVGRWKSWRVNTMENLLTRCFTSNYNFSSQSSRKSWNCAKYLCVFFASSLFAVSIWWSPKSHTAVSSHMIMRNVFMISNQPQKICMKKKQRFLTEREYTRVSEQNARSSHQPHNWNHKMNLKSTVWMSIQLECSSNQNMIGGAALYQFQLITQIDRNKR